MNADFRSEEIAYSSMARKRLREEYEDEVIQFVVDRLEMGVSNRRIAAQLRKHSFTEAESQKLVNELFADETLTTPHTIGMDFARGFGSLVVGIALFLLGAIALTGFVMFGFAQRIFFFGAILFVILGPVLFVRGTVQIVLAKSRVPRSHNRP